MKLFNFDLSLKRRPRPGYREQITLTAQIEHIQQRLDSLETEFKVKGTRLETVYRKVYRDIENSNKTEEAIPAEPTIPAPVSYPKPGDPVPYR